MRNQSPFNSLLVPTDFSDASRAAFDWALRCTDGDESVIIVLHVLDESLIEMIASHEFAPRDEVARRMRSHAEEQLAEYKKSAYEGVEIDAIVAGGLPFLEIIRKADDFAVDAIVMGRVGTRRHFEKLLFGSTAEKVLRGAGRPVVVLPQSDRG
jgi:nucleotide-binding universal stress UspA family protein